MAQTELNVREWMEVLAQCVGNCVARIDGLAFAYQKQRKRQGRWPTLLSR